MTYTLCVGTQRGHPSQEEVHVSATASGVPLLDRSVQPGTTLRISGFPVGSDINIALDGKTAVSRKATAIGAGFSYGVGSGCAASA